MKQTGKPVEMSNVQMFGFEVFGFMRTNPDLSK